MNWTAGREGYTRLLIVDDTPAIHEDIKRVLRPDIPDVELDALGREIFGDRRQADARIRFEVDSAYQGRRALELAEAAHDAGTPYAVAFVDVRMPPGWDGIETISRLWKVDPSLQIVLCTAYSDLAWRDIIARLGTTDQLLILKKPFDPVEVIQLTHALTRKRALMDTLCQVKAQRDRFFAASPDVFCALSEDGRILMVNESCERLFGYPVSELIGRPLRALIHPDDRDSLPVELSPAPDGDARPLVRNRLRRKDGAYLWIEWSLFPGGHAGTVYAAARDISSRLKLEQLKDEFVSTVSHELRTPLTSIRGSLGLLEANAIIDPAKQAELLRIARNNSDRLIRLVNDILDLDKMESGRLPIRRERLKVGAIFDAAVGCVEVAAEQAAVSIDASVDEGLVVEGDFDRLVQVVVNLLSNAIRFSPPDGTVHLDASGCNGHVLLRVQDQGCGIPTGEMAKIFERFHQAQKRGRGTGLGLPICRAILDLHKGEIAVESEEGKGSVFEVSLPHPPTPTPPPLRAVPRASREACPS